MKTSISHLPETKQTELKKIVSIIKEYEPEGAMIILFGSYAIRYFNNYRNISESR